MNQNIYILEKPMLLIVKTQTNLPPSKKMNGLPINLVVELEKLLNSVFVEIVVLLTTSLQIVLPTNVTDTRNLVILLSNVMSLFRTNPIRLLLIVVLLSA